MPRSPSDVAHEPRIFVHIPSYRDRECQWTVKDLFEKAKRPDRIFVGICWQTLPEEDEDCFLVRARPDQVRELHFHIREARGLGWARQHARSLWQGEEYSLQIDSHMRFVPDWDERMLGMLAACDSPDPVLSIYPPGYTPPDNLPQPGRPHVQCFRRFLPGSVLEMGCEPVPENVEVGHPLPTAAVAGGFIFGSSRLLRDVPFDEQIYFNGEEPSLAMRIWTHGFDMFSPHETVIYHYYNRVESSRHWNDSADSAELHARTMQRMKALCEPDSCSPEEVAALGEFGLGTRRSLAEYEAFGGVSFSGRCLTEWARRFPFVRRGSPTEDLRLDPAWRPAPGLELFILDDTGFLFSSATGEFYRLNEAATLLWCMLMEGAAPPDWPSVAEGLAQRRGLSLDSAREELARVANQWRSQGVLIDAGSPPDDPPAPTAPPARPAPPPRFDAPYYRFSERFYRLLGVTFRVRYSDASLEQYVHPVLANLEAESPSTADHTITAARIQSFFYVYSKNEQRLVTTSLLQVAPRLKFTLLDEAIRRQDHILHLHSGALVRKGRLVLLPGPSGSGKTSLVARLMAAGCTYFSDEVVLLDSVTGLVRPVPLSLCIKAGGEGMLAPYFPDLSTLPLHHREDDKEVRYLPPSAASRAAPDAGETPALLIFPRYRPGAPLELRPVTRSAALGRLLDECVGIPKPFDLDRAATLVNTVEHLECWEMVGSDLDASARAILQLCGGANDLTIESTPEGQVWRPPP